MKNDCNCCSVKFLTNDGTLISNFHSTESEIVAAINGYTVLIGTETVRGCLLC